MSIVSNLKQLLEVTYELSNFKGWVNLDIETQSLSLKSQLLELNKLENELNEINAIKTFKYDKMFVELSVNRIKQAIRDLKQEIKQNKDAVQFWKGYVALIQIAFEGKVYIIEAYRFKKEDIQNLLLPIKNICGHNLKFDLNFIKHHYDIEFSPVDTTLHDTMITEAMIICGDVLSGWAEAFNESAAKGVRLKTLSLKNVLKKYLSVELDKSLQEASDWHLLTQEMINYCESDVLYLDKIREMQLDLIKRLNLEATYKLEMATLPALVKMETNGCIIDIKKLKKLHTGYKAKVDTAFLDCILESNNGFDFCSPKSTLNFYLSHGIFIENTNSESLQSLNDELAPVILEYREMQKIYKTYLDSWLNKCVLLNDEVGILYASYNQLITATGRLSCDNPNLQNIPASFNLRELFITLPGWSMIGGDLSQVEIRIGAQFSLDPLLIEALKKDQDTHQFIADMTGQTRKVGKALNLAVWYNKTAHGISKDLNVTLEEGEAMLNKMYSSFPNIKSYQYQAMDEAATTHCVRTKGGRIRWLRHITSEDKKESYKARNAAVNTKIQGTAGDGMKRTLATFNYLIDKHKLHDKIKILLTIHDEVIAMVSGEVTDKQLDWFKEILIYGTQFYCPNVPIKVGDKSNSFNVKVLKNWGEMK